MTNTELREKLKELLSKYFDIGDSYAYNLTRVKSAFACGTMGFDDFEEFDEEVVADIADHLIANGVTLNQWIPVTERLPKSEKVVLVSVVSKQFGYRQTLRAAHIGHHEVTTEDWREFEGDTEYDEENDCFWIPECWWENNAIEDNGNWIIDGDYDVTHWMPLPEPPEVDTHAI